jgi:hypothetical protein
MFTDVSEMLTISIIRAMIALMMEAASISETLVNFYQTTRLGFTVGLYFIIEVILVRRAFAIRGFILMS